MNSRRGVTVEIKTGRKAGVIGGNHMLSNFKKVYVDFCYRAGICVFCAWQNIFTKLDNKR